MRLLLVLCAISVCCLAQDSSQSPKFATAAEVSAGRVTNSIHVPPGGGQLLSNGGSFVLRNGVWQEWEPTTPAGPIQWRLWSIYSTGDGDQNAVGVGFDRKGPRLALVPRSGGEAKVSLPVQHPANGDIQNLTPFGVSPEGHGIFFVQKQTLLRPRQPTEADASDKEDVNNRLRVSHHYDMTMSWDRVVKAFPGAESARFRYYVQYADLGTGEIRRVFTGNDLDQLSLSPDCRHILGVQILQRGAGWASGHRDRTHADLYIIDLPPLDKLPQMDLTAARETEGNAGSFDHRLERLLPVVRDVGLSSAERIASANDLRGDLPRVGWSPDSTMVAFCETGHNRRGDVFVYDLRTRALRNLTEKADLDSYERRDPQVWRHAASTITERFGSALPPKWTADSKALLVTARGFLWRVPVDGSPVENLSNKAVPQAITEVVSPAREICRAYESEGRILVRTTDFATLRDGIAWFHLKDRQFTPVFEAAGLIHEAQVESGRIFYVQRTPADFGHAFVCDLAGDSAPVQLSSRDNATSRALPEKTLLSFTTAAGRRGWGRLHLPPGSPIGGKRWPLIIAPERHGVSVSTWFERFGDGDLPGVLERWRWQGARLFDAETEIFTRAGFAFLAIDVPLTRRGKFEEIRPRIIEAFEAAAEAAIATGRIDPVNLGVIGIDEPNETDLSFNGFMVQTAISGTNRFRAAVSVNGYGSLTSHALSAGGYRSPLTAFEYWARDGVRDLAGRMEVDYTVDPARYERNSALPYFGNVKTPLLLMHGTRNVNVLPERADETFAAILPTGTKAVLDFHNKGQTTTDEMFRRAVAWFNEHLRGGPPQAAKATLPPPDPKRQADWAIAPRVGPDGVPRTDPR